MREPATHIRCSYKEFEFLPGALGNTLIAHESYWRLAQGGESGLGKSDSASADYRIAPLPLRFDSGGAFRSARGFGANSSVWDSDVDHWPDSRKETDPVAVSDSEEDIG